MPTSFWTCPVCQHLLHPIDRSFRCEQGHSFDLAKEGYVNLLLAHQRHSASPGDDKAMLQNRRAFLEADYYRPLAERLAGLVAEDCGRSGSHGYALLDTGCGEGYYTALVQQTLAESCPDKDLRVGGIDIAKEAVRLAARRYPGIDFAVASNAALPVADQGLDALLRVFAPGFEQEEARVLRPGGLFIAVTPGPRHLFALRERVYDRPREHDDAIGPIAGLRHQRRIRLAFEITVTGEDIGRLFSMTPYYWQTSREKQAAILALESLHTEVSFYLDCYRPTPA